MHSSSSFPRDDRGPALPDFTCVDPSGGDGDGGSSIARGGGLISSRDRDFQVVDDGCAMYTAATTPFDQAAAAAVAAWQQQQEQYNLLVNNSSIFVDDRSDRAEQADNLDMIALFQQRMLLQQQIVEERARQRQQQQKLMIDAAFYSSAAGGGGAGASGSGYNNGYYSYSNPGAAALPGFYSPYSSRGGGGGIGAGGIGGYSGGRMSSALAKQIQHLAAMRNYYEQRAQQALQASSGNVDRLRHDDNVCRFYLRGTCSRGENCPFIHSDHASGVEERSAQSARKSAPFGVMNGLENSFASMSLASGSGRRKAGRDDETTSSEKRSMSSESLESSRSGGAYSGAYDQEKFPSLEELQGQIYETCKDQEGCRFLQAKLAEGNAENIDMIFAEVIDHVVEMMSNSFGNYLVQKLLDVANDTQRKEILRVVTSRKGELVNISLNVHGTRAVQRLIETLQSPEQVSMVTNSLMHGVVSLIKDPNGNHVVQKCLLKLSNEDIQFILDAARTHCVEIATHRHGCCVLQRCVDYAPGAQRHSLLSEIAANSLTLSQDQYGNYVVQYILEHGGVSWLPLDVIFRLEGNFALLAMQKFSSNVVEKCLKHSSDESRAYIIREIISSSLFSQLLQDPFANYVIQCALSVAKGSLHTALVDAIRPHVPILRSSPYGKRILSRANINRK